MLELSGCDCHYYFIIGISLGSLSAVGRMTPAYQLLIMSQWWLLRSSLRSILPGCSPQLAQSSCSPQLGLFRVSCPATHYLSHWEPSPAYDLRSHSPAWPAWWHPRLVRPASLDHSSLFHCSPPLPADSAPTRQPAGASHKYSKDEGISDFLEQLPSQDFRRKCRSHERQRYSGGIPKEARGHGFESNV